MLGFELVDNTIMIYCVMQCPQTEGYGENKQRWEKEDF